MPLIYTCVSSWYNMCIHQERPTCTRIKVRRVLLCTCKNVQNVLWVVTLHFNFSPHFRAGLTKPPAERFPRIKKSGGLAVKSTGLPFSRIYRHGFGWEPVHVPGRTGSTGNRPNWTGSQRFCEPSFRDKQTPDTCLTRPRTFSLVVLTLTLDRQLEHHG
jgi:hypothetical protein